MANKSIWCVYLMLCSWFSVVVTSSKFEPEAVLSLSTCSSLWEWWHCLLCIVRLKKRWLQFALVATPPWRNCMLVHRGLGQQWKSIRFAPSQSEQRAESNYIASSYFVPEKTSPVRAGQQHGWFQQSSWKHVCAGVSSYSVVVIMEVTWFTKSAFSPPQK